MKTNALAWILVGFLAAMLSGSMMDQANTGTRRLVRDTDGHLLVVDLSNAKADYVQRQHTVPTDTLEVEKYGWQGQDYRDP